MEAALKDGADFMALKEDTHALLEPEGAEAGKEVPVNPLAVEASNKATPVAEEGKAVAEEEAEKSTAEEVAPEKTVAVEKTVTVGKAAEEVAALEEAAATASKAEAKAEEKAHSLTRRKLENLTDKAQNLAWLKEKDEVRGARPSRYVYMILPNTIVNLPPLSCAHRASARTRARVYTSLPLWRPQFGRLPLHVAAMQKSPCAAVTVLLNAYPEAIAVKDNVRGRGTPSTSICLRRALAPLVHVLVSMALSRRLHGTLTTAPQPLSLRYRTGSCPSIWL